MATADDSESKPIFDGVYFAVVRAGAIDTEQETALTSKLEENGATHCPFSSTELKHITHLIADTADFPAFNDAVDAFIHVVRPSWVNQSIWKKRISNPRQFSPDPCYFLSDAIVVIAEDMPSEDRENLIGGIQAMGGQHSNVMTKLVTHVVALTMDNAQCRIITEKNLESTPVLPHWLDHCFLLGRKIKEAPYVLPNPAILEYDPTGTLVYLKEGRHAGRENIRGANMLEAGPLEVPEPVSPSKSRKQLTVFRNHAILLGEELHIHSNLRNTLTELIQNGGGEVVPSREDADTIIVPTRRGLNFQHAVEHRKDVGSLTWLYHLINTNKWTNPTQKLLHYPTPYQGIAGFSDLKISISNYVGEARMYMENLIKAAGGTFTKTLTQENTHLITAHTISDKVDAAREWNINVVNHLWLEESYGGWTVKSVSEAKYTTFPKRTNLVEIVGKTPVDRVQVERFIFPHREPSPTRAGRPEPLETSSSNIQARSQTPIPVKSDANPHRVTPIFANASDKENQSSEGRGAKNRALNKLHSMAPDIALFHKELKRKGGVLYGGRAASDADRSVKLFSGAGMKRHKSTGDANERDDVSNHDENAESGSARKRLKATQNTEIRRFMVTCGDRFNWSAKKSREIRQYNFIEETNIDDASRIEIFVSPKILKTPKFFVAVANGATIVDPGWLDATLEQGKAVATDSWLLKDNDGEEELRFDLQVALSRARENRPRGGLFRGMTIYCTESVQHGIDQWQQMVRWNGGTCLPYKGRETKPASAGLDDHAETSKQPSLFLITVEKDHRVWKKFRSMATGNGYAPILAPHEWLIRVCLTQDLKSWEPEWEFNSA